MGLGGDTVYDTVCSPIWYETYQGGVHEGYR